MPRTWYAAVLNWFRLQPDLSVDIDFVYAIGEYPDEWAPKQVIGISNVLGTGDRSIARDRSVALFGLGFDPLAAVGIRERIEADEVYAFYASPGASLDAPNRALVANKDFLLEVDGQFGLPLESVETTYRILGETVAVSGPSAAVTMVPLGPKPHILASILAAYRFHGTCCVQVRHKRRLPNPIPFSGRFVATRVEFRPSSCPHG
jgi:hypothetical protein